ncbi:TPA: hypothetical protein DEP21_01520 [Patescibacteria group bacterium]|nr:hypothetical protein [Candidatus Gracilibacteria bacterium]
MQIKDSVANYDLQVQRAKNALDRSVIQYEQTKISVDKSLSDASTALEVAENSYNVSQTVTEQNLKKAKIDYDNTDVQLDSLETQLVTEKNNLSTIVDSVLNQVDLYLGVTQNYESFNDGYELLLGARDTKQKKETENLLKDLYNKKSELKAIVVDNPSSEDIQN